MNELFSFPHDIDTPSLLVDVDRLQSNIDRYATALKSAGVVLRPHAKTHKCSQIAAMQRDAGAVGLTVATLDEAEAFARAGFDDLFIAYSKWVGHREAGRLRTLLRDGVRIRVGVDSAEAARQMAETMAGVGDLFEVCIEVDSGAHRCGVVPEDAGELGAIIAKGALRVVGAFTHGGHAYDGPDAVASAAEDERRSLEIAGESMALHGIDVEVLSAGSSPTAMLSSLPPVTEQRPGEYVFGDRDLVSVGACGWSDVAAMIVSRVQSAPAPGRVTIDAGSKTLARDEPSAPFSGYGGIVGYPSAVLAKLSEEHGVIEVGDGRAPKVGELVAVVPNHICPVVNLMSEIVAVRHGEIVDVWPIDAPSNSAGSTRR